MKIISLLENTTQNEALSTEHGLSLYIETAHHKILFDMGQTELFADNANRLGIDLSQVDIAILSHGHYDHGGGLARFLECNQKAPVYVSKFAFEPHYNGSTKYIGLDPTLQSNGRLVFTEDETVIDTELRLYTCNEKPRMYDLGSFGLTVLQPSTPDHFLPDDFRHEQYLLVNENDKRVLISGCSHKGILDLTNWFQPDILVGGFHFSKLPLDDTLKGYAEYLDQYTTHFYTYHCTGTEQYLFMKQFMERLDYLSTGDSIFL